MLPSAGVQGRHKCRQKWHSMVEVVGGKRWVERCRPSRCGGVLLP